MPIPSGNDYPTQVVTLTLAKSFLQIEPGDTSRDTLLQIFIDAATDYVNFISGTILPQQFTNEIHSGGSSQIVLYNTPVLTVDSISEWIGNIEYVLTQTEQDSGDQTSYAFSLDNPEQGILTRRWSSFPGSFVGGTNNIVVTYTAGYATVPADIELAVLMDLQGMFNQSMNGGRPDFNGGDSSEGWQGTPMNAFPRLASILTSNRKVQAIA